MCEAVAPSPLAFLVFLTPVAGSVGLTENDKL